MKNIQYGYGQHVAKLSSRLRDLLNRLKRKTKGYSKSINALRYALAIVFSFTNIPTDFGYF